MDNFKRLRAALLACLLLCSLLATPALADSNSRGSDAGAGTLAVLSSIVYGPAKMLYAAGGLIFGGFAWALSGGDSAVMDAVITPSVRGDWVVTPDVIRGERSIEFVGREPNYSATVAEESLY